MYGLVEVLKANHTHASVKLVNSALHTLAKRIAENIISRCYINKHRTISCVPERMFGADICLFVYLLALCGFFALPCLASPLLPFALVDYNFTVQLRTQMAFRRVKLCKDQPHSPFVYYNNMRH